MKDYSVIQLYNSESMSKMASQIKYKNWHNFRSRFDFDPRFFLKNHILGILEAVSINKLKFHEMS